MWGMSSLLTPDMIKQLAAYYASQTPVGGKPGDATLMMAGKAIYEQGIAGARCSRVPDLPWLQR